LKEKQHMYLEILKGLVLKEMSTTSLVIS